MFLIFRFFEFNKYQKSELRLGTARLFINSVGGNVKTETAFADRA
jgi:hypothetical protein